MCGGSAPAPYVPPPAPAPTFTADDGTVFSNQGEFNAYQQNLRRDTFENELAAAVASATNSGRDAILARGLSEAQFLPLIESRVADTRSTIPDLASSPGTYFAPNFGDVVLDDEQRRLRNQYRTDLQQTFPSGSARDAFPDTADDAIIEQLFRNSYEPANDYLTRARSRGTLTPTGYDHALSQLQQQASGARATLQNTGLDILSGYRDQLSGLSDRAFDSAANFRLGDDFSPDTFSNEYTTLKDSLSGRLEGDLRNAASGLNLFDTEALVTRAGTFQGAQNSQGGLLDALAERRKREQQPRGVGTEGAF